MVDRNTKLRILMYARTDARSNPGGDTVETESLCDALNAAGHEAVFVTKNGEPGPWDIVHLFNIDRAPELADFLDRNDGFPGSGVVLAPVFNWDSASEKSVARNLRAAANLIRSSRKPSRNWIPGTGLKGLTRRLQGLHFHTLAEEREFRSTFPEIGGPQVVQPPPVFWPETMVKVTLPFAGPFAAVVARVEPLKNQLWLLESGVTDRLPVVFVGGANPKRPGYLSRFETAVAKDDNAVWLGRCNRAQVQSVLEQASLHILPSSRENYGLATVEALTLGCESLVPQHHAIASELGSSLHCFEHGDPESLFEAVDRALNTQKRAQAFDPSRHDPAFAAATLLGLYRAILPGDSP